MALPLAFPKEAYSKKNYIDYTVVLDNKPKQLSILGDFISVLDSNADLTKVYIGFNNPPTIPLARIASGVTTPFIVINLTWEDSETGKFVRFLIGQEARFSVFSQGIIILNDYVGVARDSTLKSILPRVLTDSRGNELSSYIKNIDLSLSVLALYARYGRSITPTWIHGSEATAPSAGATLVSKTVSSGKKGYIYGFFISAGEANDFYIQWVSGGTTYKIRIPLSSKGAVQYVDFVALNEGLPADDGSTVSIIVVNAGSSGVVYQSRLLYAEV